MSSSAAIRVQDLRKSYSSRKGDVFALDGVSFDVPAASVFGLLGPNGAGKTTLVKTLLALHAPSSGSCEILGREPGESRVRRRIGYLPEQLKIPEYYKPRDFLRDMAKLNNYSPAGLSTRIDQVLDLVGLADTTKKRVGQFSKGMQQRLGLAQAILHDPELVVLDEPTDGLDPLGRKEIRDLLANLRTAGKTVFLNSHLLSEIELICDEIVVLKKGKVARKGTPSEFTHATGEYRIRLTNGAAGKIAQYFVGSRAEAQELFVRPRDVGELNRIIDRIRAESLEIEAVEPIRATMEESFLSIVTSESDAQAGGAS